MHKHSCSSRFPKTPLPASPTERYNVIVDTQWLFVRNVARRFGVSSHHRDDIAVEVFLRFRKHVETITELPVIRAWLWTATMRIAQEHFGAPATRHETPTAAELIRLEGQAPPAEDSYLRREYFESLLVHIEALEPKRRAVFKAYAIDGLPVSQIARDLGIPPATVYNRLRLARRKLRASLRRERLADQRKRRELQAALTEGSKKK